MQSIILKLVRPITKRLGSRWIWSRGRRYHVMAKLDPLKIRWIISQKEKGTCNDIISSPMGISKRWVQKLWSRYREIGSIPVLKHPGRPRKQYSENDVTVVTTSFGKYKRGAVCLEKVISRDHGIHIPHNTIHRILREKGLASDEPHKSRKRKWVRYERTYSNSLWHVDWKHLDDTRWLIAYEDDASRYIVSYGVFDCATSENSILVLQQAIKKHGRPAAILSDRGSQFYANESEYKQKGASDFEKFLASEEIRHILARVRHPQTNGKLERFYGEVQRKLHLFRDIDELVEWWNNIRPHMSLDWDNLETPYQAYARKMPERGTTVIDKQSGEMYHVE